MTYIKQDIEEALISFLDIIGKRRSDIISIIFIVNGMNLEEYPIFKNHKPQQERQTYLHPDGPQTYSYSYINFSLDLSHTDIRFENGAFIFEYGGQKYELEVTRIQKLFPGKTPWFGKTNIASILIHGKRVD